jgi:hypothetical protein
VLNEHGIREMTNRGEKPTRGAFALDNGAYIDWTNHLPFDEDLYLKTLRICAPLGPDFIIIPDIVAGGLESLRYSLEWIPRLRSIVGDQIPLALAVQDGMETRDVKPLLGQFQVLFLGGSRPWKYRTGEKWCRWANKHGIPVHIGAIGSMGGVKWARYIDATSIDSTGPLWSKPAMMNWLFALESPLLIEGPIAPPKISENAKRPPGKSKGRDDIGAMLPETADLVSVWKSGRDLNWGYDGKSYLATIEAAKRIAADPEAPSEFLVWLWEQSRNARKQLPNTAVYDIAPYQDEILKNPASSASFAMKLAATTGYSNQQQPYKIFSLLRNPAFEMYYLEDPDYMEKLFRLVCRIDPLEFRSVSDQMFGLPAFSAWLGPVVAHYTFKKNKKRLPSVKQIFPFSMPESVTIYANGVTDVKYRLERENRRHQGVFRNLDEYLDLYQGKLPKADFVRLSDQSQPPKMKALNRSPKTKVGGRAEGDFDAITQKIVDLWKAGKPIGQYTVWRDLGIPNEDAPAAFKHAASHPAVPSACLIWMLDNYGYYELLNKVMRNPSLNKEDALLAMEEWRLPNHWRRQFNKLWCPLYAAEDLLDNPAFPLYLLDDPEFYEKFFSKFSGMGHVSNYAVYTEQVDKILQHPIMKAWLGPAQEFTFKKIKRDPEEENKKSFPISLTMYRNGVVRVIHPKSLERTNTQLYRSIGEYIQKCGYGRVISQNETPESLLAKSDQASARKKKGKQS